MSVVPVPGVYSAHQFDACANCGARLCSCPDSAWNTRSPSTGTDAPDEPFGAGLHGPASFSNTRPAPFTPDRDGGGNVQSALCVNAGPSSGCGATAKAGPVATSSEARP